MIGQPIDSIDYINNKLPKDVFIVGNKSQRRKLIKLIIEEYVKFIFNKLVMGNKVVITNVGKLVPLDFNLGAKNNPFTGEFMEAQTVRRIKFISSVVLKNKIKEVKNVIK